MIMRNRYHRCVALLLAAGLFASAPLSAAGKRRKRGSAKAGPVVSKDKRFSVRLPAGFRSGGRSKGAVLGWTNSADKTAMDILVPYKSRRADSALRAARKHRRESADADGEEVFTSKVVKKTLPNELVFYHWWSYGKESRGPNRDLYGYLDGWGKVYFLRGTTSKKASGPKSVYQVLGALRPMHSGKMKRRVMGDGSKPSLIKDQEEKDQGVPLY